MKTKVTIDVPEWVIDRLTHPKDEREFTLTAMWLAGAVLVEVDPEEDK